MVPDYHKPFRKTIYALKHNEATFGIEKVVVNLSLVGIYTPITTEEANYQEMNEAQVVAREIYLVCDFILIYDKNRFGNLV